MDRTQNGATTVTWIEAVLETVIAAEGADSRGR